MAQCLQIVGRYAESLAGLVELVAGCSNATDEVLDADDDCGARNNPAEFSELARKTLDSSIALLERLAVDVNFEAGKELS
jgi:hypothetical protein